MTAELKSSLSSYGAISELDALARFEGTRFTPFDVPGRLLKLLGDPQDHIPTVHVAGTNGKGSVCALVASMLHAAGSSVGHFASPHLSQVNERCLLNGVPAALADFDQAVAEVLALAKRENVELSYFVVGALASFLLFRSNNVDWNVIEVGLGGAFDATNAIRNPRATAITSIAFDHMHLLGNTLAEIAWNKAGIIKEGVPVFVGAVPPQAEEVIRRQAELLNAPIAVLDQDFHYDAVHGILELPGRSVSFRIENTFLQAEYQIRNTALAARIALSLGVPEPAVAQGIRNARWPGRVEELSVPRRRFLPDALSGDSVSVLLDAAHNPEGMNSLLAYLQKLIDRRKFEQVVLVLSILERKNWQEMLSLVKDWLNRMHAQGIDCRVIATKMTHLHALPPASFHEVLPTATLSEPFEAALRHSINDATDKTLVIVSGSIYFLGEVRPMLTDLPFRSIAG